MSLMNGVRFLGRSALTILVTSFLAIFLAGTFSSYSTSRIALLVNGIPITTNDVERRVSLLRLREYGGSDIETVAREELIDETLRLEEARRLSIIPSEAEVTAAYRQFADNQGMDPEGLDFIMRSAGVTPRGFRQYILGQLTWQRLLALRHRAENTPKRPKNVLDTIHGDSTRRSATTTEYTIQQIVFVLPASKLESGSAQRIREANNFRSRFTNCDDSLDLAKKVRDVSVLNRGRVEAHQLPERWRAELDLIDENETTRPLRTEKGVELLALCGRREVRSILSEEQTQDLLSTGDVGEELAELNERYSTELRTRAVIKTK